jgi:hypothetical protein
MSLLARTGPQTKAQLPVIDARLQIAIQNLIQPTAIPSRENQAPVAPDEPVPRHN